MDPVQKTEIRRLVYWACNIEAHRHQSPGAASSCMTRRKGAVGEVRKINRNLKIIAMLRRGEKPADIALLVNCSASNLIKAANSSIAKAYRHSKANGGCPYNRKNWTTSDFCLESKAKELDFLVHTLENYLLTLEL